LSRGLATAIAGVVPVGTEDPLTAEVERWSKYLKDNSSTDEMWTQVREFSEPDLKRTEEALRDDGDGRAAGAFYGALPTLHADAEAAGPRRRGRDKIMPGRAILAPGKETTWPTSP
jgi:hypothetical protein